MNYYIKSQINKLENNKIQLSSEIITLGKYINVKLSNQKWFFNSWQEKSNFVDYKNYSEFWKRLENLLERDSIEYKWKNMWDESIIDFNENLGFKNSAQLGKFIEDNSLNKNEKKYLENLIIKEAEVANISSQINIKQTKILDFTSQVNSSLYILFIVGIIAFPIRYLYYSVKWSIKTLNQTE